MFFSDVCVNIPCDYLLKPISTKNSVTCHIIISKIEIQKTMSPLIVQVKMEASKHVLLPPIQTALSCTRIVCSIACLGSVSSKLHPGPLRKALKGGEKMVRKTMTAAPKFEIIKYLCFQLHAFYPHL